MRTSREIDEHTPAEAEHGPPRLRVAPVTIDEPVPIAGPGARHGRGVAGATQAIDEGCFASGVTWMSM